MFPRVDLEKCLPWAKKLVSKTHNSPQDRDLVYSGVVGAKSGRGDVRISCLKQYGYLSGNAQAYEASDFAKKTASAPPEETHPLYVEAALRPTIFRGLFDTFQDDVVTKAKLKQRAADLNVHPDETENCVDVYVHTLSFAGLVNVDGDRVIHRALTRSMDIESGNREAETEEDANLATTETYPTNEASVAEPNIEQEALPTSYPNQNRPARAVVHVNINIDSSLDAEKLEKQLRLLRNYGAL